MTYVRSALTVSVLIMLLSLAGFVTPAAVHATDSHAYEQTQSRPAHEWWKTHRVKHTQANGKVTYDDCTTESEAEKQAQDSNDYQETFVPIGQRSQASKVPCPHKRR